MTGPPQTPAHAPSETQARSLHEILGSTHLLSMATSSPTGAAHVNTAFFAFGGDGEICILTPPHTEHATNLRTNPSAAIAVFDSHQTRRMRRGVQLFGEMAEAAGAEAQRQFERFCARFPDTGERGESYRQFIDGHDVRLYLFTAARVKIFDEELLGRGDYVEVRLR